MPDRSRPLRRPGASTAGVAGILKRLLLGIVVFVVIAGAAAVWFLFSLKPPASTVSAQTLTLPVDGRERSYLVVAPDGAGPDSPVLLVLHPSSSSGAWMRSVVGRTLDRITAPDRTVLVYPDGVEGHFNDCRREANYTARAMNIDDVAFMRAIVARLVAEHRADPTRVYALGYSNGGHMALRLALEAPDLLAGAIIVSASLPTAENLDCRVSETPTRALVFVEGTADPINPFNGGEVTLFGFGSRGAVRPARASAAWFAQSLGLGSTGPQTLASGHGGAAYKEDWTGTEGRVRLVTIESGGHTIPQAAYRFPRILGRTFRSDAVIESSWRFVAGDAPGTDARND